MSSLGSGRGRDRRTRNCLICVDIKRAGARWDDFTLGTFTTVYRPSELFPLGMMLLASCQTSCSAVTGQTPQGQAEEPQVRVVLCAADNEAWRQEDARGSCRGGKGADHRPLKYRGLWAPLWVCRTVCQGSLLQRINWHVEMEQERPIRELVQKFGKE